MTFRARPGSAAREHDLARIRPWVEARLRRQSRHEKHPVHDFLFEYYEFRPSHLVRWTPGFDVALESATRPRRSSGPTSSPSDSGLSLPASRVPGTPPRLSGMGDRVPRNRPRPASPPSAAWGCTSGRWSIAIRASGTRKCPLRLRREETDAVVESQPLRCTHFDAFRFFSPAASPLNRLGAHAGDDYGPRSTRLHPRQHGPLSLRLQDRAVLPVRI